MTTNFLRYKTFCSLFFIRTVPFHSTLTAPLKSSTLILTVVVSSSSHLLCDDECPSGKKNWSVFLFQCVNQQVEVYPVHHLEYQSWISGGIAWMIKWHTFMKHYYLILCYLHHINHWGHNTTRMCNKRNTGLEIVLTLAKLHLGWSSFYMQNVKLLVFRNSFRQHNLDFYMEVVIITIHKSQVIY